MTIDRILRGLKQAHRVAEIPKARALTGQWLRLTAAYVGTSRLAYPYRVSLATGHTVVLENHYDLATFWQIFVANTYGVRKTDLRVIDAGANSGLFTLYAATQASEVRVASVEAFPPTFERLQQTVAGNGISGRVTLVPAALHGTAGTARIDSRENTVSQFRRLTGDSGMGTQVEAITLELLMNRCGWDSVDLLKLDIEGSEYEVVLNADPGVLGRVQRIAMEYHPRYDGAQYVPEDLFSYLAKCGFRLTLLRPNREGYGMARLERSA